MDATTRELFVQGAGAALPATLTLPPDGVIRGGLIPLHPASDPSRHQFLLRHLARTLPAHGIAVLRFNRRPARGDVPLAVQAADALAALRLLRVQPGVGDAPLGLWGFSQGAWAAPLAAALSEEVAGLVLLASTGVTPAAQMRYGTAEQLRRAGYGSTDLDELAALRAAYEAYQRGDADRATTQAVIDRFADRPWFALAYVPRVLGPPGTWGDMDVDPEPILARVRCPVLLFYGEDDEWTPVEPSIATWRRAAVAAGNTDVTVVRLPGTSHHPTLGGEPSLEALSPRYVEHLIAWVRQHLRR